MRSLDYLGTAEGLAWVIACLPIGFLLVYLSYLLFNRFPAKWYCDYDEEPSPELLGKRVSYKGSGIVLSIVAAACIAACRLQFNKGYDILFVSLSIAIIILLMIMVSDFKYTIIPDQFTLALAFVFLLIVIYDRIRGYNIFSSEWWQPIAGAAVGGGVMLLINALGVLIYKKEGMGFGDVKLFAAVGILTGFPGTLYTILISLVVACVGFIVTIVAGRIVNKNQESEELAEEADNDDDDTDDIETVEAAEQGGDEPQQQEDAPHGFYLAFGPYIAIGTIVYICLLDIINSAASWYLKLF